MIPASSMLDGEFLTAAVLLVVGMRKEVTAYE
jgi:hypothetical protein